MADRKRSIRFKIVTILLVPVVSLAAIWGFAAAITVGKGFELLRISTVYDNVIVPLRAFSTALQHERLLSLGALGGTNADQSDLQQQRERTNTTRANLERLALARGVQGDIPAAMRQRLTELRDDLNAMPDIRSRVDNANFTRLQTIEAYSALIEDGMRVHDTMLIVPDLSLYEQTKALIVVGRAREQISQESALIAGAVAARMMTGEERTAFTAMATKRKLLYGLGFQQFDNELRQPYFELQNSPPYTAFERMEEQVSRGVRPDQALPSDSTTWGPTVEAVSLRFDQLGGATSKDISDRSGPQARSVFLQIAITAGLGLIAVALSIFVSLRFGRRFAAELVQLQQSALRLAHERLPRVVARLRRGEEVDVDAETQSLLTDDGTVEIASVGEAFTSVQQTAVEAAVGQAELRKGVSKVFLNLARRSQSLLHRQLTMLDGMERRVDDPEILEGLFGLDHLTTRMRRHAEGLIILSGAVPGRGWRTPVTFFDIVRGAVEEVEDYLRVNVSVPHGPALVGTAVTDVVHLIAELVENATIFSPPHTTVYVRGGTVGRGFVVEVEDRGLGLRHEEYAQINERLLDPPEFDLADSDRLGLFVVGRLASRHDIRVCLRPSPYGGTTAIVLIPSELVVDVPLPEALSSPPVQPAYSVERVPASRPGAPRHGGDLPKRVRQANLPPELRELRDPAPAAEPEPASPPSALITPEDMRRDLLTSFQAGWRRAGQEEGRP